MPRHGHRVALEDCTNTVREEGDVAPESLKCDRKAHVAYRPCGGYKSKSASHKCHPQSTGGRRTGTSASAQPTTAAHGRSDHPQHSQVHNIQSPQRSQAQSPQHPQNAGSTVSAFANLEFALGDKETQASKETQAVAELVASCAVDLRNFWAESAAEASGRNGAVAAPQENNALGQRARRVHTVLQKFSSLGPPRLIGAFLNPPAASPPFMPSPTCKDDAWSVERSDAIFPAAPLFHSAATSDDPSGVNYTSASAPTSFGTSSSCRAGNQNQQAPPRGTTITGALGLWPTLCGPDLASQLDTVLCEQALSILQTSFTESERHRPAAARGEARLGTTERGQVVVWLFQVCHALTLHDSVLHMTVLLLDRYCAVVDGGVPMGKLQQIVLAIMCTALKVTGAADESTKPRRLRELLEYLGQQQFSVEDILTMELEVLDTLGFNVTTPTPLEFLEAFVVPFVVPGTTEAQSPIWCLAKFLLQLSLLDAPLHYRYPHAVLAAGCVYVALWCSQADPLRAAALLHDTAAICQPASRSGVP